jgi:hypothetical protein
MAEGIAALDDKYRGLELPVSYSRELAASDELFYEAKAAVDSVYTSGPRIGFSFTAKHDIVIPWGNFSKSKYGKVYFRFVAQDGSTLYPAPFCEKERYVDGLSLGSMYLFKDRPVAAGASLARALAPAAPTSAGPVGFMQRVFSIFKSKPAEDAPEPEVKSYTEDIIMFIPGNYYEAAPVAERFMKLSGVEFITKEEHDVAMEAWREAKVPIGGSPGCMGVVWFVI